MSTQSNQQGIEVGSPKLSDLATDGNQLGAENDNLKLPDFDPTITEKIGSLLDFTLDDSSSVLEQPRTAYSNNEELEDDVIEPESQVGQSSPAEDGNQYILHVGDGNFSFTRAYVNFLVEVLQKPEIAKLIIATERKAERELSNYGERENIAWLRAKGVRVLFGVDACSLDTDKQLQNYKFRCIRWNNPCLGGEIFGSEQYQLKGIMAQFYKSAKSKLVRGGFLIVTIEQDSRFRKELNQYKQALVNLVSDTTCNGFALLHSNSLFNKMYIPFGYKHRMTKNSSSRDKDNNPVSRTEFVFQFRLQSATSKVSYTKDIVLKAFDELYKPPSSIAKHPAISAMLKRGYKLVLANPHVLRTLPYPEVSESQYDLLFDCPDTYKQEFGPPISDYQYFQTEFNGLYFDRAASAMQIKMTVSTSNSSVNL